MNTLFEVFSNCGRIILLKPPRLVMYQIRGPKLCTIHFWVRGIYLLYYLVGIFLFLILPNSVSVYHYYWLSKYKITHKENSIYLHILYFWKFNKYPTSFLYLWFYIPEVQYTILFRYLLKLFYAYTYQTTNLCTYTSMYLSLLSTSSTTKAPVNPFWQSFFLIRVMQIVFVSR